MAARSKGQGGHREEASAPPQPTKGPENIQPKRIVLFSDGTGNSSAKLFKTNVWRLYDALDVDPLPNNPVGLPATDPKRSDPVRQIAYYDDGVGTSSFKPLAVLGGALGMGLARNVRDIYAFLCRHHRDGDEIHGFGFSRGAFTMRIVAGLVARQGLIRDFIDDGDLDRKVAAAYRAYRQEVYSLNSFAAPVVMAFRGLRDLALAARNRLLGYDAYTPRQATPDIEFLGLWDTVDAYGLPIEEMTAAWDQYIWPLTMRDSKLHPKVKRARHVIAIDDERQTFHPRLWDHDPEDTNKASVDERRIAQVWFAGVHSNVGGGYPNDTLSFVSLNWMLERADRFRRGAFGLRFHHEKCTLYRQSADPLGPIYDSRRGLAGYYRYQPRRFAYVKRQEDRSLIKRIVAKMAPRLAAKVGAERANGILSLARSVDPGVQLVHHSVFDRMRAGGNAAYAPLTIDFDYRVVGPDAVGAFVLDPVKGGYETGASIAGRNKADRSVYNIVWLKRFAYFGCLFLSLWLAAFPFLYGIEKTDGIDPTLQTVVSVIPQIAASLMPGFLKPWFDAYAAHPWLFLKLLGGVAALLWLGGYLAGTITGAMQSVWHRQAAPRFWFWWPPFGAMIGWLRTRGAYGWLLAKAKGYLMPAIFAAMFYFVAIAVLVRVHFSLVTEPAACAAAATLPGGLKDLNAGETLVLDKPYPVSALCWGSGVRLAGGSRYEIALEVLPLGPLPDPALAGFSGKPVLLDQTIRADAFGFGDNQDHKSSSGWAVTNALLGVALPLRRNISAPWFTQHLRSGVEGRDSQALVPKVPPPGDINARTRLVAEFTARGNGEMFLFTNDAMGFFGSTAFYDNNVGTFSVTLKRLDFDPAYSRP